MRSSQYLPILSITVLLGMASGCASIVSGRHAEVAFHSYPVDAHVTVRDDAGQTVASLDAPGVVALKRNRRYFLPARYTATFEAPGHEPRQVAVRSTLNPWILGNILFGGIPGIVIDSATGAAWTPRRSEIHAQLAPLYGLQMPVHSSSEPVQSEVSTVSFLPDEFQTE